MAGIARRTVGRQDQVDDFIRLCTTITASIVEWVSILKVFLLPVRPVEAHALRLVFDTAASR